MSYRYYTETCSLCGIEHPKRELNKLYISFGHTSVVSPKKMCSVCDNCWPNLCEVFEISLPDPDNTVNFTRRRYCKRCYKDVNKNALFCQFCGSKLTETEEEGAE